MSITVNNSPTSADLINVAIAVHYLTQSPTAASWLARADVSISINNNNINNEASYSDFNQISWDPHAAHYVFTALNQDGIQSPAVALFHEIVHSIAGTDEAYATLIETMVANERGDAVRGNYTSIILDKIYVENPSEHTHDGEFMQYNIDGSVTKGGVFSGQHTAYPLGWGPASGAGGGSAGSGSYFQNVNGIDIIGSTITPPKIDKSHWQQANYDDAGHVPGDAYLTYDMVEDGAALAQIVGQSVVPGS